MAAARFFLYDAREPYVWRRFEAETPSRGEVLREIELSTETTRFDDLTSHDGALLMEHHVHGREKVLIGTRNVAHANHGNAVLEEYRFRRML